MSNGIKFALPSAAHVMFFNDVIMPQMEADKFFGQKRNYNFAIWKQVEVCVVEPGQAPGGYQNGVKYPLPQSNFDSYLQSMSQGDRDQLISAMMMKLHQAGYPVTAKLVRNMTHVYSKAIRYLVQMNEDGSYTLLDGKPGHIPGAKAADTAQQLAEMKKKFEEQAALLAELQAQQAAKVQADPEKDDTPLELTEDQQIEAMIAAEQAQSA